MEYKDYLIIFHLIIIFFFTFKTWHTYEKFEFRNRHTYINSYEWMNEWMTVYPYSHVWITGKELPGSVVLITRFTRVCICLTTDKITDGSHWWQIDITFIKRLDPKIRLPHRCQIPRLANKTPPQSIMPTGSEHVVGPRNAPFVGLLL